MSAGIIRAPFPGSCAKGAHEPRAPAEERAPTLGHALGAEVRVVLWRHRQQAHVFIVNPVSGLQADWKLLCSLAHEEQRSEQLSLVPPNWGLGLCPGPPHILNQLGPRCQLVTWVGMGRR